MESIKPNYYYSILEKSTKCSPQASVGWQGFFLLGLTCTLKNLASLSVKQERVTLVSYRGFGQICK